MANYCRNCNTVEVDDVGDLCANCALMSDPYQTQNTPYRPGGGQGGRRVLVNPKTEPEQQKPLQNKRRVMLQPEQEEDSSYDANYKKPRYTSSRNVTPPDYQTPDYSGGQSKVQTMQSKPSKQATVKSGTAPLSEGIIKNVISNRQPRSFLQKYFDTVFNQIPYAQDDEVTTFQVYPDLTGMTKTVLGHDCDQVIMYGKLSHGMASENNTVEVYGRRDKHNNIIASKLVNTASGTIIKPLHSTKTGLFIFQGTVALCLMAFFATFLMSVGMAGFVYVFLIFWVLKNPGKTCNAIFGFFRGIFRMFGL